MTDQVEESVHRAVQKLYPSLSANAVFNGRLFENREAGQSNTSNTRTQNSSSGPAFRGECFQCGVYGHSIRSCNNFDFRYCSACKQTGNRATGHVSKNCPNQRSDGQGGQGRGQGGGQGSGRRRRRNKGGNKNNSNRQNNSNPPPSQSNSSNRQNNSNYQPSQSSNQNFQ